MALIQRVGELVDKLKDCDPDSLFFFHWPVSKDAIKITDAITEIEIGKEPMFFEKGKWVKGVTIVLFTGAEEEEVKWP